MQYRDRRLRRAERLRTWSENRAAKVRPTFDAAFREIEGIPLGQPILVGHHSERRHRAALDRHDSKMRKAFEHQDMARSMASRADEIERQADNAIYSDDVDAVERLREKIAGLEAERARIKTINAAIRKGEGWEARLEASGAPLTADERAELLSLARHCAWHDVAKKGYPPYKLQNLGGNVTRLRARLQQLSGAATPTVQPTGDTATARAGLIVEAGRTTPTRPGKQPRPVWTVRGNLAEWRPLLMQLDGHWYRGAFSFWDDPTAAIEAACADAETPAETEQTDGQP